ncbi:MAG: SGNH/GDSL hydrolase family protein [Rhodospirillaceae bacterium]|nr:SGNH/GDSL hydrolase family protein [Rhodospirillaceae bacterium]MBT3909996.1 SGNH/GDSL hydrolase family protein [Rhodospirillaceae bacterium]MBT5299049.1 SGNH/GDSL hydrolase family protein [Rhodospirillaceae bacterium]MBT5514169.1 SGNH/GDSL hydrolase family protein [Rhodospirillaceae bacterium]MBT6087168.1 SGNH/GDSL hydrolase family protein [Rhodospirillaceae bacterium]
MMQAHGKSILITVIVVVAGLLAMELGVRTLVPQILVRGYNVPDPDLGTYVAPNARYRDTYTKEQSYDVRTNGAGFRMDEEVSLSEDRRRVLVYGDSFTFGWGLELKDTYFQILKKAAETADPRLQLLNAGVGGYGSGHVKKLMDRHIPALKPAAIVYFFNNNDLVDNAITDIDYRVTAFRVGADGQPALADVQPFAPWKRFALNHTPYAWLNRNSHLFVAAKSALKVALKWKPGIVRPQMVDLPIPAQTPAVAAGQPAFALKLPPSGQTEPAIERMIYISELHIRRIAQNATAAGVPIMLIWVPAPEEMFPPSPPSPAVQLLIRGRTMLSRVANETPGMVFDDIPRRIPSGPDWQSGRGKLRLSDGHFNADGAAWYAAIVKPMMLNFLSRIKTPKSP